MRIKHIRLENIRSFTNDELAFPEGTILLCGDIGAGKSTILLGVEFALFGILRGTMNGTSLLRNGEHEGSVTLTFAIGQKEITIKRTLKRQKDTVQQGNGYIVVDDVKTEGTSTELKARVLELLGYPQDLLSKSKNLIYRFTVFTPQEEMKQILVEDSESRVDTLRKAFGIDKYHRIRENIVIYARKLKEDAKVLEGKMSDLHVKEEQCQQLMEEIEKRKKELDLDGLQKQREVVNAEREKLLAAEKELKVIQAQQNARKILDEKILNEVKQRKQKAEHIGRLTGEIAKLKDEVSEIPDRKELQEQIDGLQKQARALDREIAEHNRTMGGLGSTQAEAEKIKQKIAELTQCPFCEQEVGPGHKEKIRLREDEKLTRAQKQQQELQQSIRSKQEQKAELDLRCDRLNKQLQQIQLLTYKKKNYEEKVAEKARLQAEFQKAKETIADLNRQKMQYKVENPEDIEKAHQQMRNRFEAEQKKLSEMEKHQESIKGQLQVNEKNLERLQKEILEKKQAKQQQRKIRERIQWLEEYFTPLMRTIELNVMRTIQREFNEYFKRWFSMLIEDELLSARLDEEFTPILEQNGYETSVVNLSGGEKTSCALAYRLALNKVINDVVESIKTKDLIILDEPTDGFSSEQLDRVRDVLDTLDMQQVILVSHESKIEGFVDTAVHVKKQNHVSQIE
ncbi:MAG: AAA family ATPase [Nanobdellota archaeon]